MCLLVSCGSSTPRAGYEPPAAEPREASPDPEPVQYLANPVLTMEVFGPSSAEPVSGNTAGASQFIASVRVTNTGDAPANIEYASVGFAAYRGDERVACDFPDDQPTAPAELAPGANFVFRGTVHCELIEPGRYEIHAYVHFGASAGVAEFDLRREYAGRYWVTLGEETRRASSAGPVP